MSQAAAGVPRVVIIGEMAETADPAERQRWLTFALVGAGPTGVELAGQIHERAFTATHVGIIADIDDKPARAPARGPAGT